MLVRRTCVRPAVLSHGVMAAQLKVLNISSTTRPDDEDTGMLVPSRRFDLYI